MNFNFKEVKPLKGWILIAEKPTFNSKEWLDGTYQKAFEKYINDSIGFRPWLIKLHNQIQFSVFNEASANAVVRGKENYLYELSYIKAYNGEDFLGSDTVINRVKKIKKLQNKLAEFNKTLIICINPGKGTFYPEYIPNKLKQPPNDSTNLILYQKFLKKYKINHIDFNSWFIKMKDKSDCILYPKYGIHWSHYGMFLVVDSLVNYIEQKRNIQMPHFEFTEINHSKELKYTDYDIAEGMNLFFQMPSPSMCYPETKIVTPKNSIKPKTLVISDSFYWSMYNVNVKDKIFKLGGFWYYNKQIYPESEHSSLTVDEVDIKKRVLDNDVIIIMSTDANLPDLGWGFINSLDSLLAD